MPSGSRLGDQSPDIPITGQLGNITITTILLEDLH